DRATLADRRSPGRPPRGDLRSAPVARSGDRATTERPRSAEGRGETLYYGKHPGAAGELSGRPLDDNRRAEKVKALGPRGCYTLPLSLWEGNGLAAHQARRGTPRRGVRASWELRLERSHPLPERHRARRSPGGRPAAPPGLRGAAPAGG